MEHAGRLARPFPWRTAALVVGALALAELVVLLALAGIRLAPGVHAAARPPAAARHAAPAGRPVLRLAPAAGPLRPRSRLSVLVLNGNGVAHAAGREAARLLARGYRSATPADAASSRYARSLVLFAPGYGREAARLGHDAGIPVVAPLDGMRPSQLHGSQLVVILGGT